MFGLAYIAVVAAIALLTRSKAALVALPALMATVWLFWAGVGHAAAYSSAMWVMAGAFLIIQGLRRGDTPISSDLVAGTLYGISGLVYVLFYLGFSNATLATVPIVSDLCFISGLVAGTWPNAIINIRRGNRCDVRRTAIQIARADLAGDSMPDRCGN